MLHESWIAYRMMWRIHDSASCAINACRVVASRYDAVRVGSASSTTVYVLSGVY